ncbi:acyltransferase [Clostridium baratii]|uniref:acyltransferase n=1 Tax=Clostridium baratii TaxID=1561 RepID=UPI001C22C6A7|nr:acyltransferase [Clostridium baratii]
MDFQKVFLRIKCEIKKIIYKIFFKNIFLGKNISFRNSFFIRCNNGKIVIKDKCFFNNNCSINSLGYIEIGENCIFGENVKLYDHNHKYTKFGVSKNEYNIGKIIIGNNVWIGSNVTILKDVNIGEDVIIGANCFIREDIPKGSIVYNDSHIKIKNLL